MGKGRTGAEMERSKRRQEGTGHTATPETVGSVSGGRTWGRARQDLPRAPTVDQVAESVLDHAFRVHRRLGPGLKEKVYETLLERVVNNYEP